MNTSVPTTDVPSVTPDRKVVTAGICFVLIIFGVLIGLLGNGMICLCMWRIKSLRTPVNNLILNMAVIGMLASVTCLPMKASIVFYEALEIRFVQMEDIILLFVFLHSLNLFFTSVQLLTLASISFERYQAIAKPFEKSKRSRRVRVTLFLTWSIATGNWVSYVITEVYAWNVSHSYVDLFIYDRLFFVVGFLPFSSLAILIIIVLYCSIVRLIMQHINKTQKKVPANKVGPSLDPSHTSPQNCVLLLKNMHESSIKETSQITINNTERPALEQKQREVQSPENKNELNVPAVRPLEPGTSESTKSQSSPEAEHPKPKAEEGTPRNATSANRTITVSDITGNTVTMKTKDESVAGPICIFNPKNREQGKRRLEARTAKIAGLVIVIFLSLWVPYQLNIIHYFRAYGLSRERWINNGIFTSSEMVTQTLAIGSVCVTPFVFAFVNKDLRRETKKLVQSITFTRN